MQHLRRTAQQVQLQGTGSISVIYLKESFLLTVVHPITQCCYCISSERVNFSRGCSFHLSQLLEGMSEMWLIVQLMSVLNITGNHITKALNNLIKWNMNIYISVQLLHWLSNKRFPPHASINSTVLLVCRSLIDVGRAVWPESISFHHDQGWVERTHLSLFGGGDREGKVMNLGVSVQVLWNWATPGIYTNHLYDSMQWHQWVCLQMSAAFLSRLKEKKKRCDDLLCILI